MRGVKAAQEGGKVGSGGAKKGNQDACSQGPFPMFMSCQAVSWDSGEPQRVNEKQNCHFGDQCQKTVPGQALGTSEFCP